MSKEYAMWRVRDFTVWVAVRMIRWAVKDSNLVAHARRELCTTDYETPDDYNTMMAGAVLELIEAFAAQGHSGMSAHIIRQMFNHLAKFEPLGPLVGDDKEWNQVTPTLWQNRRCSRVFKNEKNEAWDIDGKVFREPNGFTFTSVQSHVPVTFPYTPTTVVVEIEAQL